MRALIVDDEADIGIMTKIILKNEGIRADDVNSIKEAKTKIRQNDYDIYFLDLNLPDGSGFDLMPQIRKKNEAAGIVIISAFDGVAEIRKAHELEVDDFIKKPFSKRDIKKAIEDIKNK